MDRKLSSADKFDLQQNYRRFLKYQEQFTLANDAYKDARASRVWIGGLVMLLFALASDFFLGASAALFGLYFYRIVLAWFHSSQAEEGREQMERWFAGKGLKFQGRVLYFRDDEMLARPIDPFDDALYG
ncbi:hypothetical protein GCM10011352_21970 [Marinobacterium zhoushanense]|uniref:Uncharacterized protein n=1 Tax=Marinobacterium zhoushanense TaxID=1679163 RepID=A0ABQ1KF47_9GAMM|nr:hypothetical protein [Marinobacterium zhoushanense]GGB95481.1 hypothetical protein GCM10011352_21970 [Marinobacterium zhoushanense]